MKPTNFSLSRLASDFRYVRTFWTRYLFIELPICTLLGVAIGFIFSCYLFR